MLQAFVAREVVTPDGAQPGALLVEGGTIRGVCGPGEVPREATVVDCGRAALLPGLVDTHVHINEPGRTEWEGFWTATRAAAAGGYTLLVDMPLNCLPETTTVAALEAKRAAAAGKCRVDWRSWGGVVASNGEELQPLARAGAAGFKCFLIDPGCEGLAHITLAELERSLPRLAATGLPLLVHAELGEPIERAGAELRDADWTRYATYLASRPDEAETEAIDALLELCRRYQFRLHIVHLATAQALARLRAAKDEGLPVTVETCPHYLYFAAEEIPGGATLLKCAPPIRGRANREALWAGLRDGTVDLVATDHSPCPPEMKQREAGRFDRAWGGVASLALALPAMHTAARERGFTLPEVVRWMSEAPARLAGADGRAGRLEAGREANFVLFDPERRWTPADTDLWSRHAVSPYVGEPLTGAVEATFLRGGCVWDGRERTFPGEPVGREFTVC